MHVWIAWDVKVPLVTLPVLVSLAHSVVGRHHHDTVGQKMGKTVQRAGQMNGLHRALSKRGWLIISTQGSFYRFRGLPFLMAASFHYVGGQ